MVELQGRINVRERERERANKNTHTHTYLRGNNYISMGRDMLKKLRVPASFGAVTMAEKQNRVSALCFRGHNKQLCIR